MVKERLLLYLSLLLAAILLAAGCKPASPSPAAPAQPQSVPAKSGNANADDAAWTQVVAAAKKEGKLTLYTWGMTGQPGVKVAKAFKDAYGIGIETVTGVIPTLIERMKTEAASGKNTADTFDASASSLQIAKDAGLSLPVGYLPALTQKSSFRGNPVVDQSGYMLTVGMNYYANLINSNRVKAGQEPKSYQDLLDPRWNGKIVVSSPVTAVGINRLYALKESVGLDDDYFRKLGKNGVIVVATDKDAIDMVARGEADVTPSNALLMPAPDVVKGAPVKAAFPSEGTMAAFGNTISILKNAPHPNAARLLVNWLLSPEGQKVYGEASAWTPIRNDVPDYIPAPLSVPGNTKIIQPDMSTEGRIADLRKDKTVAKLMGIEK